MSNGNLSTSTFETRPVYVVIEIDLVLAVTVSYKNQSA